MTKKKETIDISIRLDKWLWCARFYKTRHIAASALKAGKITANGERAKPSKRVQTGDILNIHKEAFCHTVTVKDVTQSRKSASDTALLYEESPDSIIKRELVATRIKAESLMTPTSKGRPGKKDRRSIIKFKKTAIK